MVRKFDKRFKSGNLLINLSYLSLIIIVDPSNGKTKWSWGDESPRFRHRPLMTKNGRIYFFENGTEREFSSIVGLDPISKKIDWRYEGNPKSSFYSKHSGSIILLNNGNLLVDSTLQGAIFELTPQKKIVWNWLVPNSSKAEPIRTIRVLADH